MYISLDALMADMRIPSRRSSLVVAVAVLAASALFGTSLIGSIFHIHKSAEAEATCPICQISHCVAVRTTPASLLSFPHLRSGELILPLRSVARLNAFLTLDLTRAPPAI